MKFIVNHNEDIRSVVLRNACENLKLTAPNIQKQIVSVAATEITKVIINKLGDALSTISIDESRDILIKEKMVVALCFVDKWGCVIQRFLGIVQDNETTSISLKAAIEALLSKHGLSVWRLHGHGYDGASSI